MDQNRPSEHPPEHAHDPEICATCEAWYADNDPYDDFMECARCHEWFSGAVGHDCPKSLLKQSYEIRGFSVSELSALSKLLTFALKEPYLRDHSFAELEDLRTKINFAHNEMVVEGWDDIEPF